MWVTPCGKGTQMSRTSRARRQRRRRDREVAANLHQANLQSTRNVDQTRQQGVRPATTRAYRRQMIIRLVGWSLAVVGLLMAGAHVIEHLGAYQVMPTLAMRDLLIGYPMAGLLIIAGVVVLGR